MKHNRLKQFFQDFYLALILLFLYIPIVTMIVLSFNNTKSRTVWGGFTTRWYTQMFQELELIADKKHKGKLPVHVAFWLDEFANSVTRSTPKTVGITDKSVA